MNDLQRFKEAQKRDFDTALSEIRRGRKRSHWMWYIFPQIQGLGFSSTSAYYAIQNMAEAEDFLNDPYLGANLRTISEALLELDTDDPYQIFGSPDHLKLLSCMTLFEAAEGEGGVFTQVIEKYYDGRRDDKTLYILEEERE
ncbi:MAG TPA: DUF1810 domain-containing protein [Candidatus Mediterraneibacter surreyensis]|nr:DUF1810 domain-containing protein [Candidatus Mediterraneibacter surreyensis]